MESQSHNRFENEKKLFENVKAGNITDIRSMLNDLKASVNCFDDEGMTPLQHAAFKGQFEICKLLLDCGADVNANKHTYGYSALCLAAISNHCDVVVLLLEHGANATAINSNKRTASEMAAFVGNHKAVCIINNYISKDFIDYFTEAHGLEKEPRLPMFLSGPLHKFVVRPNIHPVRIVLYLLSTDAILQNMKKVIDVLNIFSEKQLKEMNNERMSLKAHHIAFILSSSLDHIVSQKKKTDEKEPIVYQKILFALIKSWLKGSDNSGNISVSLEKFLRKDISAYPFRNCMLYQHIVTTVSSTELGNDPNALTVLNNAIIGYNDADCCACCGDQNASKKCSVCKNVQYCDKTCQKLHWFIHKNICC